VLAAARAEIPRLMCAVGEGRLSLPLVVDVGVGANWDEAH
jgi:DNA polymerase I-like protein with 3'-5' exonuclease and polymerase domains